MKNYVKPTLVLFLICFVATFLLGMTNSVTAPIIEKLAIETEIKSRQTVFPDAVSFGEANILSDGTSIVAALDEAGSKIGYVVVNSSKGYGGDISVMMNSITAAQHKHTFIYRGWEVHSEGNPYAHAILRGYVNKHGQSLPNYHYEDLVHLAETYANSGLTNPAVIVDTNHANSGKKYLEQTRIAKEVLHSCRHDNDVKKLVKGFMIESYIEDGAQKIGECIYGKSITDPCLGWEKTERLILDIADQL